MITIAISFAFFVAFLFMCDIADSFSASSMWHCRVRKGIPSKVHIYRINTNDKKYSLSNKCIGRYNFFSTTSLLAAGTPSKSGGSGGTALDTRVGKIFCGKRTYFLLFRELSLFSYNRSESIHQNKR